MNTQEAAAFGEAYEAIELLRIAGLITPTAVKAAMKRLGDRAFKVGYLISRTDVLGKPLQRQIRVHWMGVDGRTKSRTYPRWPGDPP